jgi:hypothetical protein
MSRLAIPAVILLSAATPVPAQDLDETWLYLGRRAEAGWKPPSVSLARPRYPVRVGQRLVVKQDALVYGSVDCKVIDAAEFKVDESARSKLVVKAGGAALEVVAPPLECPSIGRAQTVWAKVRVPSERLASVEK